MNTKDIMSKDVACCTPETPLPEVARLMVKHDCGEIPVVESRESMKPVGVITDRDITCRTVAEDKNPVQMKAADCMSTPVVTVADETSVDDCCRVMEENQIRRVPVVDDRGRCCGIVSQADIARHAPERQAAEVVRDVSEPTGSASRVHA